MSIEHLPLELVSKICGHLDFQQQVALRSSCRALYQNSFEHFAGTHYQHFERIRFILTSESLHELEHFSKSKGLRERVQELWMIPTVFEGTEKSMGAVSISSKSCRQVKFGHPKQKARHDVHKEILADHISLLESETLSLRLRKCLDLFENLHTIGLAHYTTEFLLDPRQKNVPFFGRRQMMERIDFRFDVHSLQAFTHTNCDSKLREMNALALLKLLQALCGSKCRPRKLHTCDSDFCGDIGPTIALSDEQYESLLSSLKDVKDLHLCVDLHETAWQKLLTKVAPQLEKLTLSQDHKPAYMVRSYGNDIFFSMDFNQLRELHIHELHISFNALESLLTSARNLVTLTLEDIRIRSKEPTAADDPTSQYMEYLELQSLWRYAPTSPLCMMPAASPYPPVSPGVHPEYPPGLFNPTSPPVVTSPASHPFSPVFHRFSPTLPFLQPTPPSYRPDSPLFAPTLAEQEVAPPSPQLSWISDSEPESATEEYLMENSSSIYHPWTERTHIEPFSVSNLNPPWQQPSDSIPSTEPNPACIRNLLDLLRNLHPDLEKFEMDEIMCDNAWYWFRERGKGYIFTPRRIYHAVFPSSNQSGNAPFGEWISKLETIASSPKYRSSGEKESQDMKNWFGKMIGLWPRDLPKCDCKRGVPSMCPFGCVKNI